MRTVGFSKARTISIASQGYPLPSLLYGWTRKHDMPEIGKEHSGSELNLEIGESLELRLPENPTTGYRWQLRSSGSPVLELMEDSPSPAGEAVGAGRVRRWVFRAAQAGLARLELEQ